MEAGCANEWASKFSCPVVLNVPGLQLPERWSGFQPFSEGQKPSKGRFKAKLRRRAKAELLSAALTSEGGLWGFNQSVWKIGCRRNRVFAITSSDRREELIFPVINQRFLLLSLLVLISLWPSRNHHTLWPCASLEPQLCRELEDWLSCPHSDLLRWCLQRRTLRLAGPALSSSTDYSRTSTTGSQGPGKWFKMTSYAVIRIVPLCDIQSSSIYLLQPILCLIEPSVVKE